MKELQKQGFTLFYIIYDSGFGPKNLVYNIPDLEDIIHGQHFITIKTKDSITSYNINSIKVVEYAKS